MAFLPPGPPRTGVGLGVALPTWATCAVALVLAAPGVARAQVVQQPPAPIVEPPKKAVPIPPKLTTKVDPIYPKEKLAKGEKANVKVELTIDATGKVTNATILESGGPEFDASALEAAARLVFQPATLEGKAIASKIPYRFSFDFKDEPTQPKPGEVAAAKLAVFEGTLKTPTEEALPGATVMLFGPAGENKTAVSDTNGLVSFKGLAPGKWRVHVASEGFTPFDATEQLEAGKVVKATYRPKLTGGAIDVEVKGDRPPREVTVHVLDQKEITRIPGTNGDALRAVQALPGVARPPGLSGLLIIRGASPFETNIFVDGTLVPIVYHFGGLSSVVPSELLERIDFRPGNFGPEYGRVHGGIIDVGIRSPKKDGYHGLLQFDLIDGRMLLEGPIDKKTRFAVAGRRSWVDAWLGPVLREVGVGVSTAPVYYDYQLMVERDVTDRTTARLLFFGSNDRLAITINTPFAGDPTAGGDISTITGFWRLQGRVEQRMSENVKWTNTLAYGSDYIQFNLGDIYFKLDSYPTTWRSDVRAKIAKDASFIGGVDIIHTRFDVAAKFPPAPAPGEAPGPFFGRPARELTASGSLYRPAAYMMLDLSPVKGLKLLPGVRVDWFRDTQTWEIGPRFATRYDVVQGFPRTTLKGGAGIFHQPPQPEQVIAPFGTPGLKPSRATHYSLGFEQEFTKALDLSVEGFYKDIQLLVSRNSAETTTQSGTAYGNRGDGRVIGMELLLRYKRDSRFFGWIAYTLSRAERRLRPEDPLTLFVFDQTHILQIIGSYQLGKGWEFGARFRYVSGRMYTPNVGGVYDYDSGSYAPVPQVPSNQSRLPAFHQLDIRIDKVWKFTSWQFSAYLDLMNTYNRRSPEGVSYNYNYTKSEVIGGLTILPVIGIRGEM